MLPEHFGHGKVCVGRESERFGHRYVGQFKRIHVRRRHATCLRLQGTSHKPQVDGLTRHLSSIAKGSLRGYVRRQSSRLASGCGFGAEGDAGGRKTAWTQGIPSLPPVGSGPNPTMECVQRARASVGRFPVDVGFEPSGRSIGESNEWQLRLGCSLGSPRRGCGTSASDEKTA